MVAGKRAPEVKGGGRHAQRSEDATLHGGVVGSAEFELGKSDVAARKSRGSRHRIGVLKKLAELARRLHRPQGLQLTRRRNAMELQYPLVILARHAGASADQVLHQNAAGCVSIAKRERGQ